jgi:hypothetical protein
MMMVVFDAYIHKAYIYICVCVFYRRKGERTNRYEFRFRTTESNGLILWLGRGRTLAGDFLAIALVNGYAELSFNLGRQNNFVVIRSKVTCI